LIIVGERAGHPLNLERLDPKVMLDATIASFGGDERPLADVISTMMY
jgi:cell filamentation protein